MSAVIKASMSRRWWNRRVCFPDPAQPFVPTSRFDLLRSMRSMLRLMIVALVLFVGMFAVVVAGYSLPVWSSSAFSMVAVVMMFTILPPARSMAVSLLVSTVRSKWSGRWVDAGVPLVRLWTVIASPVSVDLFARYTEVLESDKTAYLDGGVDPRLVWYLNGVGMTPSLLAEYAEHGLAALDAVAVRDAGIDPDDWALLKQAGVTTLGTAQQIALFAEWVRGSRISVHPDDFAAASGKTRTLAECLPVIAAWTVLDLRRGRAHRRPIGQITGFEDGILMRRVSSQDGDVHPYTQLGLAQRTVGKWVEMAGILTPYFIEAGIGFEEAAAMVAAPTGAPRVEDVEFLGAWGSEN